MDLSSQAAPKSYSYRRNEEEKSARVDFFLLSHGWDSKAEWVAAARTEPTEQIGHENSRSVSFALRRLAILLK